MPIKPNGDADTAAWFQRSEYVLIALLGLLYLALMGKYGALELDNIWFLSFSHSFWVDHISTDGFMLSTFPSGMGGVCVRQDCSVPSRERAPCRRLVAYACDFDQHIFYVVLSRAFCADVPTARF
jgi:hypothetical protein